jgi:hypothetical protein
MKPTFAIGAATATPGIRSIRCHCAKLIPL